MGNDNRVTIFHNALDSTPIPSLKYYRHAEAIEVYARTVLAKTFRALGMSERDAERIARMEAISTPAKRFRSAINRGWLDYHSPRVTRKTTIGATT